MQLTLARPLDWRWQPLYWTLTALGIAYCAGAALGHAGLGASSVSGHIATDALSYQHAVRADDPYVWTSTPYRYSPAFLWAVWPLAQLPWEAFAVVWFGLHIAAFVWLRAGWMLAVPGLNEDVIRGNVNVFVAVLVVLALQRSSAWWMPILLTKVTPGVGLVWHLARREWRALGMALGLTLGVAAIGSVIAPGLWTDWIVSLSQGQDTYEVGHPLGPLPLRLLLAAGLTWYAARAGRAWLVPVAMVMAMPGLWPGGFALLAAIPRLRAHLADGDELSDVRAVRGRA